MLIDRLKSGQTQQIQRTESKPSVAVSAQSGTESQGSSVLQRQLSTLGQWSVKADVAQQLAKNQQAEQQLRQLYQQLEQLRRQLDQPQSSAQKQQLSQQLQQLEQQLKQKNSALKPELQLASAQASQQQWQLHQKIDLLSPRPVAETVKVQLGNGQLLQLSFAAGQSAETSLQQIQQVFADAGIEVKAQAQTLVFSSQKQPALLQQAWQVQGEGVRLAAGNPIQLKLQAAKNPLTLLADQARQLDNQQAYQAELAQVQQKLQGLMRQVQAERQILLNKLNALQQADSTQMAEQALQTSAELKLQMQTGAAATVPAILSQGQITRSLVEFALAG
ncbi:hypothetical protein ACFO3I_02260 [Rheinheimera marina]|uniref:Flagellar hook-length control protein-like C-terminal domain-containing protein n=1 Tax=Rheinheimera marina TaxID=1774958 RepID=A0ABV9JHB3_9GAMM